MWINECFFPQGYQTPEGFDDMVMESDGLFLTALSFIHDTKEAGLEKKARDLPVFRQTKAWLDSYFKKAPLPDMPPLKPDRSTPFRGLISDLMACIPYGESVTYGELAVQAAKILGKEKMSAQAVGQAVGHNPLCILIPCHRVLGAGGALTGYGGGLENKRQLLFLEDIPFKDPDK